jgi:hypothetical protein
MSTASVSASLDSLVKIPERFEKWQRLDDSEPFAQLHRNFWGKSMAEEEKAWHEQQSISDPSSNNQSPEEKSGENTLESKDDDITPGCYVLDIDNELIGIKRIWVRVSPFTMGEINIVFTNLLGRIYPHL